MELNEKQVLVIKRQIKIAVMFGNVDRTSFCTRIVSVRFPGDRTLDAILTQDYKPNDDYTTTFLGWEVAIRDNSNKIHRMYIPDKILSGKYW
jgi:hypothetical protein